MAGHPCDRTTTGRGIGVIFHERFRVQGSGYKVQGTRYRVQGSGFKVQGSAQPLALKAASLIEKETLKKRISNNE
jgi:glutamate dehydrogenase/leucine dehydrogenase